MSIISIVIVFMRRYSLIEDELKEALREAADILDGKLQAKTYHSVEELIEDLDSEV